MTNSSLAERSKTGFIVAGVFAAVLLLAHFFCFGRWLLILVATAAVVLSAYEFSRFAPSEVSSSRTLFAVVSIAPAVVLACLVFPGTGICSTVLEASVVGFNFLISVTAGVLLTTVLFVIAGRDSLEHARLLAQRLFAGFLLIGIGGASLIALSALPGCAGIIAWFVAVVAINDIAAYFGGQKYGGPALASALSPKKTISGSLCGLGAGAIAGVVLSPLLGVRLSFGAVLASAALIVVAAQAGDLLKSFLKREAGVKDSGSILPGHGGILDRIDGQLLAGPLFFALILLSGAL